ncbi:hypothetical protein HRbin06_00700 [archaeon HR06]|nr:hypothetical protein HRbin06_00700 [archaeon HR06]
MTPDKAKGAKRRVLKILSPLFQSTNKAETQPKITGITIATATQIKVLKRER